MLCVSVISISLFYGKKIEKIIIRYICFHLSISSSVHPSLPLPTQLPIHPFIIFYPVPTHSFLSPSTHLSILYPFNHLYIHPPINLSIHSSIFLLFIHPPIYSSVHPSIHPLFTLLPTHALFLLSLHYLLIHLPYCLLLYSCTYPSIHSF